LLEELKSRCLKIPSNQILSRVKGADLFGLCGCVVKISQDIKKLKKKAQTLFSSGRFDVEIRINYSVIQFFMKGEDPK